MNLVYGILTADSEHDVELKSVENEWSLVNRQFIANNYDDVRKFMDVYETWMHNYVRVQNK